MKKILPILMAVIGICAGIGAGVAIKQEPEDESIVCEPDLHDSSSLVAENATPVPADETDSSTYEYVKLSNQFVIPIVDDGRVKALVVLALNLEVVLGYSEAVFALEPKLRNAFLLVLFDHANAGGFEGSFTSSNNMMILQNALLEAARKALGNSVSDVLITDVVRQETLG